MNLTQKIFILLLCLPSGTLLLLHVFGLSTMFDAGLWLFLPCTVLLAGLIFIKNSFIPDEVKLCIKLGVWGGLLGTFGYDLIRIPFALMGLKVFLPISVYGIWITDYAYSGFLTELVAWTYHFSNGITFGIMYALFMRKKHWIWGVVWAFVLETIVVLSPFSGIFGLTGNYTALGIAYLGHIAYGIPLGWVVMKSESLKIKNWMKTAGVIGLCGFFVLSIFVPRVTTKKEKNFVIFEPTKVSPKIIRSVKGKKLIIHNNSQTSVTINSALVKKNITLNTNDKKSVTLNNTGIYILEFKPDTGRATSGFVIVEPVLNSY